MKLSRWSFASLSLAALLLTPQVASADEWTVTGKVVANPLRIETLLDSYDVTGPPELVEQLTAIAGMGRSITAKVNSDGNGSGLFHKSYSVSVQSVTGHAAAPTAILSEPRAGAAPVGNVGAMDDVTIVGQAQDPATPGTAGQYLEVQLPDGTKGYMPSSFTSVGEDHSLARDIGKDILGPIFAHTSASNDARTFHPDGSYFEATVTALTPGGGLDDVAQRLAGKAIVRPSLGVHKAGTPDSKFDVPGFTIRLTSPGAPMGPEPNPGDENFTFLSDLTNLAKIAIAPFVSDQFDFFNPKNVYYPAMSFKTTATAGQPSQDVQLRVVPVPFTPSDASLANPTNGTQRDAKLAAGVAEHKAALTIEAKLGNGAWTPVASVALDQPIPMDNEAFHYYPDLAGRGIVAQGVVNALRAELYPLSQAARPATDAERAADEADAAAKKGAALEKTAGPQGARAGIVDELKPVER